MILVDTSVWIDHVRGLPTPLERLLGQGRIVLHPFVMGELLLNGLPPRSQLVSDLDELPEAPVASTYEVAGFIGWAKLAEKGLGYVDTHLLVSAKLMSGGSVLTLDRNLHEQAERLALAFQG